MTQRTKVLLNALHAKSGGGITYLRNMLPRMAQDDRLEIHLLIHREQREIFEPIAPSIEVHEVYFNQTFWRLLLWEQIKTPLLARRLNVDVTFSPANFGPLFAPSPIILLRNAVEVGRTESRPFKRFYWMALAFMTALSVLRCRRVIAVSQYAAEALTFGILGKAGSKVTVVHHGVDPGFMPGPKEMTDPPFLLAVGDLYVQKNFETLLEAFAYVTRSRPRLRLKIAGRPVDADYRSRLDATVQRLGLEEWVDFMGEISRDDLIALYQHCRLFVFPSTVETFGQPLAEAMACGSTIVSSQTAAMPEVAGDAALFCDPTAPRDIAEKIGTLLRDDSLSASLAERASARAKAFSWDETARRTGDVLVSTI